MDFAGFGRIKVRASRIVAMGGRRFETKPLPEKIVELLMDVARQRCCAR
jgi:hypothetical protein